MQHQKESRPPKWPFFLGDALLLGAAWFIYFQSKPPMGAWQMFFLVLCVGGAAWLGIMPFLLQYRLALKLIEAESLTSTVVQLKNLEGIAAQINSATDQWNGVQEQAGKTATLSKSLVDRMTSEVRAFSEFMQRANESEKANLRLEVEKLRRAESDWLNVLIRTLDHVFALYQGALRSNQPRVIEQVGNFQNACRDVSRKVGLVPYTAESSERFDAARHQVVEKDAQVPADALVAETIATGYTFQGRLVRRALVRVAVPEAATEEATSEAPAEPEKQSQLALEEPASA